MLFDLSNQTSLENAQKEASSGRIEASLKAKIAESE